MEALASILHRHAEKYPHMQPTDAVKLIYQNVFGGGHLIRDTEACLAALEREYENTPRTSGVPLLEDIGNGMVRVMLCAMEEECYSIHQLGQDFIRSSQAHRGSLQEFLPKLDILRQVTAEGAFGFSPEALEAYLTEYEKAGYPMVSHSARYREHYHPAYRIVLKELLPENIR